MKISNLYGLKTESLQGDKGYVIAVNVENKKIVSFTCVDENEEEFLVNADRVKFVKDKLIYYDKRAIKGKPLRLGKQIYDCEGNFLGELTDFTFKKNTLIFAHSNRKKYSADDIICGDIVIVKSSAKILKSDVTKNGKIIIPKGTPLDQPTQKKAMTHGVYIQANLKTI